MSRLKKSLRTLLEKKDFSGIIHLSLTNNKITPALISLSYDKKSSISWRAMEAIGLISRETAKTDPDSVRNVVGRLLWMIRDESGGIGWSVPEMLGEIVKNNPELCADIAPIIASFHEEMMLTAGVLWAIGRIGALNREMVDYATPFVISYLHSENKILRGYAARALGEMAASASVNELEKYVNDDSLIDFYEDGELTQKAVGEITTEALKKLKEK